MSEKVEKTSERRSYWETLAHAGGGRRFWGRLIVLVLFLLPLVALFTSHLLYQVMSEISSLQVDNPTLLHHMVHELRSIGFLYLSVIVLLCGVGIYFVFFLTVRVYGPQVALIRFIEQLKAGNYEPYRSLRRDDQLKEIWQGLQELATELKQKSSR